MKKYNVNYERDDTGWWIATVNELPGCHTQGRTIDQARSRIREAMGLFIQRSRTVNIVDHIVLPGKFQSTINHVNEARKQARIASEQLQQSSAKAAVALTKNLGVSMRDAAELLGLSHQRIHQLVKHG
jgi:predicted RNase H-like HicB family nuclease